MFYMYDLISWTTTRKHIYTIIILFLLIVYNVRMIFVYKIINKQMMILTSKYVNKNLSNKQLNCQLIYINDVSSYNLII